jgi:hypothetical protein
VAGCEGTLVVRLETVQPIEPLTSIATTPSVMKTLANFASQRISSHHQDRVLSHGSKTSSCADEDQQSPERAQRLGVARQPSSVIGCHGQMQRKQIDRARSMSG